MSNRRFYDEIDGMLSAFRTNYRLLMVETDTAIARQRTRIERQVGAVSERMKEPQADALGRAYLSDFVGGIQCPDLAAYGGTFPIVLTGRPGGGQRYPSMIVDRKTCDACPNRQRKGARWACRLWPEERRKWNAGE